MYRHLRSTIAFGRRLLGEIVDDRLPGLAAEIAFFGVLGLFPALLLAAGLLGVFGNLLGGWVGVDAQRQLIDTLNTLLTPEAAPVVASIKALFQVDPGRLLSVAAVGGLITISGAVAVVIEALNLAYDVTEHRGWLHRRLLGLAVGAVTVVVAAMALAVLVVGPLFGGGRDLAGLVGAGDGSGRPGRCCGCPRSRSGSCRGPRRCSGWRPTSRVAGATSFRGRSSRRFCGWPRPGDCISTSCSWPVPTPYSAPSAAA